MEKPMHDRVQSFIIEREARRIRARLRRPTLGVVRGGQAEEEQPEAFTPEQTADEARQLLEDYFAAPQAARRELAALGRFIASIEK